MSHNDVLDALLVEDNPGDVRLIEEMLRDSEQLLQRFESAEQASEAQIHHEETLASGVEQFTANEINVVLLDLGLPDSRGIETLATMTDIAERAPIVVLTGLSDEGIGIKAIQHGAQDYLVKDEVTSDLLVRSIHYAIERHRQERERARRREQLEALNRLNEISHDVTHAVITTSTREDLEQAVCDQFVASDAYCSAWIGEVDRGSGQITPQVAAGVEDGYLDEMSISIDDEETAGGPAVGAVRTGSVQVMQNMQTDPDFEPWREQAVQRGYQSGVSIPIGHQDVLYGVLNIYAPSPTSFSEPERAILSRLGKVIGHAITAIERQEALVSDTVLELEFQVDAIDDAVQTLSSGEESRVSITNFVRTPEHVLMYGRATGVPRERFQRILTDSSLVDDCRLLSAGAETYQFEVVTTAMNSLVDAVGTHGGRIASVMIAGGGIQFTVGFPPGQDKRQLVNLVKEHCPGAENRAQRLVEQNDETTSKDYSVLHDSLTGKQRTALRTAYSAGLFEWPRQSTGQELAERLGVSPPTFNQHLRAAERIIFTEIFSDDAAESSRTDG